MVESFDRPVPLCRNCSREFAVLEPPACHLCSRPLTPTGSTRPDHFREATVCGDCRTRDHVLDATFAAYEYRGLLRDVVADWKFDGHPEWGAWLGHRMATQLEERIEDKQPDAVVPVPLHESRYRERGFNQAEQLARSLSEAWGIPVHDVLRKTHSTPPQAELSREQRLRNLQGVFSADSDADLEGKDCLLVDDVFTTGSTLRTISEVLLQEGVQSVTAVVLARAV